MPLLTKAKPFDADRRDKRPRCASCPDTTPFVSVIVPVYNDGDLLPALLRALADQDYPADRFECLIIDNASEMPLSIHSEFAPWARVLGEARPGSYAARNRGVRAARGDILAFTDADCIPYRTWLSSAVRRITAATRPIMVAGGLEVFLDETQQDSALGWHSVVNDLNQARFVTEYRFAATANMITTRKVFDRVGEFDPELFSGGDWEWGQRAWASGIEQVYDPQPMVRHPARADWKSLVSKTRRIAGGHYTLHRLNSRPWLATAATTIKIAASSLRRSWSDPHLLTVDRRMQVLLIDLVLRLIQLGEVLRLSLGGQPRRR